jgi:hypothetical protein
VYNIHETSFFTDPGASRVISAKEVKVHHIISGSDKSCFTAMTCIKSAGDAKLPLIVFADKHLQRIWKAHQAMKVTTYAVTENG